MKLITRIVILAAAFGAQAGQAPAAGTAPGGAPYALLRPAEVNCASEDMQLFYYYLAPEPVAKVKERPTNCHGSRTTLKIPDWLETALPAMRERKVWKDPEEGELSEAQLWQTAVSILYEFASNTQKTLPVKEGGAALSPSELEARYNDIRLRFMMSVDRIARAGLEGSFGGRGLFLLSTMNKAAEELDTLTNAAEAGDKAAFGKSAAGTLKLSRDLFAQLFEAPRGEPGGKFTPKYTPEARLLPGYRGVSLSVPGSQALFLRSGEKVDMLVTFDAVMGAGTKEKVTATILQNVLVVKVHKPESAGGSGVVQLLCNPNEAQYVALSLVQSRNINLVRRAPGDIELHPMEIASFRKLFK